MDFDLPELAAVSSNSLELLTIETGEELTNGRSTFSEFMANFTHYDTINKHFHYNLVE